ncbi:G-protein coupled receptor frpr-1 [Biomphalaria pfeifferi]|uniref:G-protein coupled receptor frpr-1 n=1 Tax=Biomphalaria pfeifferi TaxID=112525 RepID=A0AAD8EVR1_BIOPF|nr:G-protein coupled receptor frpr-1 [Biomphalaria pfeifferi]
MNGPQGSGGTASAKDILISMETLDNVDNILNLGIISFLAILGICSNFLNIVVFSAQGFQDSVNISLTPMAIWDLLKCIVGLAIRVYGPLRWISPAYKKTWKNISTSTLNYVMAAYVAIERCLCVTLPFRLVIEYSYNTFYQDNGASVIDYFNLIGIVNPIFSFLVIVVCTAMIFYRMHKMSKFRSQSVRKQNHMSSRGRQIMKMLLVVITVYILALLPRFALYAGKMVEPGFYYLRAYHNLFNDCAYVVMTVYLINASVHLCNYLQVRHMCAPWQRKIKTVI